METENTEKEVIWSNIRNKKVNFVDKYLVDQIRTRYAMFDRPSNGKSNVVIDSFVPRLLVAGKMNDVYINDIANLPRTSVAIHPMFANMFGVKQMEIEQLCRILGYSKKDLKALMTNVKRKEWDITFVGAGGSVANTVIWLSEIAKMTNTINLFKNINIYEREQYDISNLLRIPKDMNKVISRNHAYKINGIKNELKYLSRNKINIFNSYLSKSSLYDYEHYFKQINIKRKYDNHGYTTRDEYGQPEFEVEHIKNKHIFYGAPDIKTREMLVDNNLRFLSATHGGNDFSLILNPTQDSNLQVESYGIIQLSQFFMNQLHMAIKFLEFLSEDNDLDEKNRVIAEDSFNGESKLPTDRKYSFQMEFNGLMMDENQVNNIQEQGE